MGLDACPNTANSWLDPPQSFLKADFFFPGSYWAVGGVLCVQLANPTEPALLPCGCGGGTRIDLLCSFQEGGAPSFAPLGVWLWCVFTSLCMCGLTSSVHSSVSTAGINRQQSILVAYIDSGYTLTVKPYGMYLDGVSASCSLFCSGLCVLVCVCGQTSCLSTTCHGTVG